MSVVHPVDVAFATIPRRLPLFSEGWGDEGILGRLASEAPFATTHVPAVRPVWGPRKREGRYLARDGTFVSPEERLPPEARTAHVRWLRAERARGQTPAACIVLAGSRDEGYELRQRVLAPVTRSGIDVFLLENPYYGLRRPFGQEGGTLRTVSDHVTMNVATVKEARGLFGWLRACGYDRLLVAGYSMGGYMAALTAAVSSEPLAVAALAAGASPAPVFTRGLLSRSIRFDKLGGSVGNAEIARARMATLFEFANVMHYPVPKRPDAAIVIGCARDGFVPPAESRALHAHWGGSELRVLPAGHVSALFTCTRALRTAAIDALERLG